MKQARSFGHDSEFGLERDGFVFSALDVLPGRIESEEGALFPDNLNAEIAITPVTTLSEFHRKTEHLLGVVADLGFTPVMSPMVDYPDDALKHELAHVAGCLPDRNAYLQDRNPAPKMVEMGTQRTCGAHVHAALLDRGNPDWFARWMDILVAVPLLAREEQSDRRRWYGDAGCLRVKDYGAEYRTLSNVWVADPALREFVWDGANRAAELAETTDPSHFDQWEDVPLAIRYHDLGLAAQIIDRAFIYGVQTL